MTFEEFSEQVDDILSSGQGGGLSNWHKTELTTLFAGLSQDQSIEYVNSYYDENVLEQPREGELNFICKLLNVQVKFVPVERC